MKPRFRIDICLLIVVVAATITYACDDLIEESLKDGTVVIIAPTDGTVSYDYTQTFWWENLEGALSYRLQIVYNKFDSAAEYRLDTLVSRDKFTITLEPAKYQWRVQAINGSSKTDSMTIQDLRIDSTTIEGQDILLTTPPDGYTSNNPVINFAWQSLPGALEYQVRIFALNNSIVLDSVVHGDELSLTMDDDSNYYWMVTGKQGAVSSNPSEERHFTIDRVSPDSVKLLLPVNNVVVSSPVTLSWEAPDDTDLANFEIFIYKGNESTPFSSKYNPYSTVNLNQSLIFEEGETSDVIFWKVRTVDKAGNKSSGETLRKFTIQ